MVGYVNTRGLKGSRYILEKISEGYDILLLQETKLADDMSFELNNFVFPDGAIRAGLAMAYRKNSDVNIELLDATAYNTADRQLQLIKVTHARLSHPVIIANVYIHCESAPTAKDWEFLQDITYAHTNVLVMGDFNARHASWDKSGGNRNGKGLYNALSDLDMYLLNSGVPTRLGERAGDPDTVIDLTLASGDIKDRTDWRTGYHIGSDHLLCQVRVKYALTRTYNTKKIHPYHGCSDNSIWGFLRNLARKGRTSVPAPRRKNAPDWWTADVDSAWVNKNQKDREFMRAKSREPGTDTVDFVSARVERNKATALYKKAAAVACRKQWDDLCERSNLDTAQFWNFLRNLDKRYTTLVTCMYDEDGNHLQTTEEQGQAFLNRFIKQSDHDDGDARTSLLKQLDGISVQAEPDQDFTEEEIISAIKSSRNGAPGPDAVGITVFKHLDEDARTQLTRAYNKSWRTGEIPEKWTDSYINPVPKPHKDHRYLKGHRIITCQNVIGKIPEKIVARRLTSFIEPFLPTGLGGYRPGRETWVNAAAFAAETWEGFEAREDTLAVALDLEDAYNKVHLPLLSDKMLHLGISVQCVKWVMAALSKRRCILKYRNWRSEWTTISTGLPQGSPLSPVLFNIYTRDLAHLDNPVVRIRTFADDILVSAKGDCRDQLQARVQSALSSIMKQCEEDGCEINGDKAAALFCTLNNKLTQDSLPVPAYGGTNIEPSNSLRYLGVVFDRQLNFTDHVNNTLQRAIRGMNALRAAAGRKAEERHLVTLYKALVLSVIDYALPMVQLNQNQLNCVERLQNSCLRIITGCTRSTPIPVLQHLVGVTSIRTRQELARTSLVTKSLQEKDHGLHQLMVRHKEDCMYVQPESYALRTRKPRVNPHRRLNRKSWVDSSFVAVEILCGLQNIAPSPMWSQIGSDFEQRVVIRFGRECREWSNGRAEAACRDMFREIGGDQAMLVATDGSFDPAKNRAGWGFAAYLNGEKIMEQCGAHNIYTSSTRMEVEAVNRALQWLAREHPDDGPVIVATDSMALLSKIQSGWIPVGWIHPSEAPIMGKITWVYVPGHSGVLVNEEADRLAATACEYTPLGLYHSDIKLLGRYKAQESVSNLLVDSSEGCRLREAGVKYGTASTSHHKGPDRCRHNQLITGNISQSTLHLLLQRREMVKEDSVNWMPLR